MKTRLANLFWFVVLILVVGGFIYALTPPRPDTNGQRLVAETRQKLRQQGFKTDLADFNFSTSPELLAREAILKATASNRPSGPFFGQINLMEIVGTNSAIVVWKQASARPQFQTRPGYNNEITWDDFRRLLNANGPALDAACAAAMSGPIAFNLNASRGGLMLLPHGAVMRNLTQILGSRTALALHDGNLGIAWTNLMAATRLVTAWQTEPAEMSHLVRFANTKLVFNATWQALQTNHWPEDRLAQLQAEWGSVNFFTNLPEVIAFQRASRTAAYEFDRNELQHPPMPFGEFVRETWPSPFDAWYDLQSRWRDKTYLNAGKYDEEKDAMLFYRDREIERRNAVQATTWMQMRSLPGVTNEIFFLPTYNLRPQAVQTMRQISRPPLPWGLGFLGHAAEAEAERRILITAIALERYRGKYGSYPDSLAQLTPEFLKNPLPDFIDGQPLRYRPTNDGHFLLYAIGLDCVDNGGKVLEREERMAAIQEFHISGIAPEEDIIWPIPATP